LFPLIRNHQVSGIIIAVLKNEDTYVEYLKMSPEAENYYTILELFRAQYIKSTLQNKNNISKGSGGPCGFEGAPPCDIDTIIIIVPGGGSGGGGLPPGGGGGPSGGCGPYEDCIHKPDDGGGGGGETTPTNPVNSNPCTKTKNLVNKPKVKDSLNALKGHAQAATKKERGFQELKGGNLVKGNVTADNQMFFGIGSSSLGTVHSHQPGTIGMFAPQDIMTFLEIVRQQDSNNLGNAYSGMVSSNGTYFINFTGTASDLPPAMTEAQEAVYVAGVVYEYRKEYYKLLKNEGKLKTQTLSNYGLEKLFFTLIDKIGLSGKISLIKEDNGNTSTIQKDSNGNPIPNPC
uniref:hypothetical protein n=1 Tax=Chryseobacterium contaminans TaxID=1423959 RepID=UPI003AFAB80D